MQINDKAVAAFADAYWSVNPLTKFKAHREEIRAALEAAFATLPTVTPEPGDVEGLVERLLKEAANMRGGECPDETVITLMCDTAETLRSLASRLAGAERELADLRVVANYNREQAEAAEAALKARGEKGGDHED